MLQLLTIFSGLLLLAMLAEPIAKRLKLPFSSLLVVLGFLGSELIVFLGFDTGLRWDDFVGIILHLLVPIIIFESAFNANTKALIDNAAIILFLAIPAMMFASAITGGLLFLGINNSLGFPLITAMLAGIILSATDPVAVVAIFKQLGAPPRLNALLEGESLFNDATAIVLYTVLVSMALGAEQSVNVSGAIVFFLKSFLGGVVIGIVIGFISKSLVKLCDTEYAQALLGIISAISVFYVAEHLLHVSGIVAVLFTGLVQGAFYRKKTITDNHFATNFWELNAYIANAILFILVGVTITVSMFTGQWLAMLMGVIAASISRALLIYGLLPGFALLPGIEKTTPEYKKVLMWGGLRGAVSLALALSLPTEIEGWYTVQSIVYGFVIFTLFVQAPFMDKLVRRVITER